jgi:hypothetical protein
MTKKNMKKIVWAVRGAVLLVVLLLAACGGESTNLRDPAVITSTSKCSDLAASDDTITCISGRFIDEAVVNLDYSCDKVNAVTDVDGSFSCPKGSKVKFMLLNPDDTSDSAKKIVLGELVVKAPASFSKLNQENNYFYVTPNDFGTGAINMVRLLQSLNRDTVTDSTLPSRRVILSDDDKRKLVSLPSSLGATDFSVSWAPTDLFEPLVKPFLDSLSPAPSLVTPEVADGFLEKSIFSTVAGAYFVPGYGVTGGYVADNVFEGDLVGMRGITTSDYLVAANWTLVDRRGRMIGFGVYTAGADSEPDACKFLFFNGATGCVSGSQPVPNVLKLKPDANRWSNWNRNGDWRLEYDVLNASGVTTGGTLSIVQGAIVRAGLPGSAAIYEGMYDEDAPEGAIYGSWQLTGGAPSFASGDTSMSLTKSRAVAPTLDPDYWKTSLGFPLNVKLSFFGECTAEINSICSASLGYIRITILEDGNIVSNLHNKCGAGLSKTTLKYTTGEEEFPLGVVAQIFPTNSKSRTYMSPMLMIPDNPAFPSVLRNIQMGTFGAASDSAILTGQLRLRVDQNDPLKFLHVYDDAAVDDSGNATDNEWTAYWNNEVQHLKRASSYDGRVTSAKDSCD